MAGCCSLPFCLCRLLFSPSLSPFHALFTCYRSLFPFVAPPSVSARRWRGMITKWLLARWLNGSWHFPRWCYTVKGGDGRWGGFWPPPPVCADIVVGSFFSSCSPDFWGTCFFLLYRPTNSNCTITGWLPVHPYHVCFHNTHLGGLHNQGSKRREQYSLTVT